MTMIPPSARDTLPRRRVGSCTGSPTEARRPTGSSSTWTLEALIERDARASGDGRAPRLATTIDFGASHSGIVVLEGATRVPPPARQEHHEPGRTMPPAPALGLPYVATGMLLGIVAGGWLLALLESPSDESAAALAAEAPKAAAAHELSVADVERTPISGQTTARRSAKRTIAPRPEPVDAPVILPDDALEPVEASSPEKVAATPKAEPAAKKAKTSTKPRTSTPPTPRPAAADAPSKPIAGDLSAACILDPAACDVPPATSPRPETPRVVAEDLPDKPSTAQIRTALDAVRLQAKACADRHGGLGESVRVKLSIAGATGTVTEATALAPQAGSALGRCVADALSKAKFPRFEATSVGVVYPVRL